MNNEGLNITLILALQINTHMGNKSNAGGMSQATQCRWTPNDPPFFKMSIYWLQSGRLDDFLSQDTISVGSDKNVLDTV